MKLVGNVGYELMHSAFIHIKPLATNILRAYLISTLHTQIGPFNLH